MSDTDQARDTASKPHARTKESTAETIELRPDADERFRAAVRAAAKSGPKHRPSKAAKR